MNVSTALNGAALPGAGVPAEQSMGRIIWASVLGTVVEWYDFLIYGTAAALVFNKLFFPTLDPTAGTMAAFGSYAVGFVARPLGGALFGHYGDRIGRKAMLTMTMLVMGAGTFLIGCLPTYSQIGLWAPALLVVLRFLQGLGVGGEWGGAVLMVIEHAPPHRRGLYGSLVQIGFPAGIAASTLTFLALTTLPEADFLAWGWRLPFLLSALLIGVGLFVRRRLAETPAFARMKADDATARMPVLDILIRQPRVFLIAVGLKVSEVAWVYVLTVFSIVYATGTLGLPRTLILNAILWAAILEFFTMPLFGWMSDQIGRRPTYFIATTLSAICGFVVFGLLATRDPVIVVATIAIVMSLTHAMMFAPEATFLPELFGTNVRYSGASLGCQVGAALSGGFSPIIASALLAWAGATWPISVFLALLAAITLVSTLAAPETRDLDITQG
jgi:MHS family shikimate/dehydroshikimate transporter-like MFS transporter